MIIHTNLVIKKDKRNKEIRASSIMLNQRLIFGKIQLFSQGLTAIHYGANHQLSIWSLLWLFFVKLISFMVKNIKGKFLIRIRIITYVTPQNPGVR